jgi:HlyD family secretion protein
MSPGVSSDLPAGFTRARLARLATLLFVIALTGGTVLVVGRHGDPFRAAAAAAPDAAATAAQALTRSDFVRTVRVTGRTEATRSRTMLAPQLVGANAGSMSVTKIAKPGTAVNMGDVVVEFDRQAQDTAARDRRAEYDDLLEQIAKTRAAHEAARVKDESELAQAVTAVQSLELEILKNEMLSRIDAQENEQKLEAARVRERGLRDNLPRKRDARAAELRILEIKRDRARLAMEQAMRNADAMVIRAPMDGLIVARMMWKNTGPGDVQEGDQVWPGLQVLDVVNADAMIVRARVNQADVRHVRAGQPAVVRLDAYPDRPFKARVEHVAPLATQGSFSPRVRLFTMLVSIEGTAPGLVPDLTAAVDVEVERVANALLVPREALTYEGTAAFVTVRDGNGTSRRRVKLGPMDELHAVVLEGLAPGEVIAR